MVWVWLVARTIAVQTPRKTEPARSTRFMDYYENKDRNRIIYGLKLVASLDIK